MENFKKIIERIKEENIQPIPKWYFTTKNMFAWLAFAVSIFIGAAAFSVILFSIQQVDFDLVSHLSHSGLELILGLLPFFWIVALLIFLVVAIFSFQKSKQGYKFTRTRLVGFSTAISILLGTLFFIGGGAQWLDNTFEAHMSSYEGMEEKKMKIWMNPEKGYLSGSIEEVNGDVFQLIDFNGKKWDVSYGEAFIPSSVFLEKGEQVKLIGEITETNDFRADEVRPWGGIKHRKKMKERMEKELRK